MTTRPAGLKPALSYDWLTQFYDPLIAYFMRESKIKAKLLERARLAPGQRVLDLGCGTATLTLLGKKKCPQARLLGLDGDPAVLQIAAHKAAGASVPLVCALAESLPLPDGCFDRVLSSLMIHHLDRRTKTRAFEEIHRILAPDGEFHLADFGRPRSLAMKLAFLSVQLLDGFETTRENAEGRLPYLIEESGFESFGKPFRFATIIGSVELRSFRKLG